MLLLGQVQCGPKRVPADPPRPPDGQGADLLGSRNITIQQRGTECAGTDIIKPMALLVLRQQRADIDIEHQQIANHIVIFGARQAPERLGSARICRQAIKCGFQFNHHLAVRLFIRPFPVCWRHLPRAQPFYGLLPNLGMPSDLIRGDAFQIQFPLFLIRIMAAGAVLTDHARQRGRTRSKGHQKTSQHQQ